MVKTRISIFISSTVNLKATPLNCIARHSANKKSVYNYRMNFPQSAQPPGSGTLSTPPSGPAAAVKAAIQDANAPVMGEWEEYILNIAADVLKQREIAFQYDNGELHWKLELVGDDRVHMLMYCIESVVNLVSDLPGDPNLGNIWEMLGSVNEENDRVSHQHVMRFTEDEVPYISLTSRLRIPESLKDRRVVGLLVDSLIIEQWQTQAIIAQQTFDSAQAIQQTQISKDLPENPYPEIA